MGTLTKGILEIHEEVLTKIGDKIGTHKKGAISVTKLDIWQPNVGTE